MTADAEHGDEGLSASIETLAWSMNALALSNTELTDSFRVAMQTNGRRIHLSVILAFACAALAVLVLVGVAFIASGLGSIHGTQQTDQRILQKVQATTNPNSVLNRHQATRVLELLNQEDICLENHENRIVAQLTHKPIPPIAEGCSTQGVALSVPPTP